MNLPTSDKVTAAHLERRAYLYVRQSTVRQVFENTESTERQYALRERALALGWREEDIVVIDDDLGKSGASSSLRDGFQRLVSEAAMGRAGIVMGLEVSRLARNSSDWHRLLEICALTGSLILDEDGLYDPAHFNDRLLLGLKGTMSEAELHVLRARLQGGILSKAQRGELRVRLPIGLVYDPQDRVVFDPDKEVRESVEHFFRAFRRLGAACAVVREFYQRRLRFPMRMHYGPRKGEVVWRDLTESRAIEVTRNPRYAGAYAWGRRHHRRDPLDGSLKVEFFSMDQWRVLLKDHHVGYITWGEYEENLRRLESNSNGRKEKRRFAPREGPALLQGVVVCGKCGARMSVRYRVRRGAVGPDYVCAGQAKKGSGSKCQSIPGEGIDDAIGRVLLEVVSPVSLEVALAVQREIECRIEEADELRRKRVERARYEADCARQRYMVVDAANRLVAGSLEAAWNDKLRQLAQAQEEYEEARKADRLVLDEQMADRILSLVGDFGRLWNDAKTPSREKKRMLRLIVEDVTLARRGDEIFAGIRFRGGATRTLTLPRPRASWEERQISPEVVEEIDRFLDEHTHAEIADLLNERGYVSGTGKPFDGGRVGVVVHAYHLKTRYERLRQAGLLTLDEIATRLGLSKGTVKKKRGAGTLGVQAWRLDDNGRHMFEDPDRRKHGGRGISASSEEM